MTEQHLPMTVSAPLTRAQRTAIVNLVRRAGRTEIMPRFRRLSVHQISEKTGPQDLVTEADHAAEAMIARGLLTLFPNALIVGEEEVSKHPKLADKIADAETAFTIDPVDGTWNYAHGLTQFGVIVSMTRFGTPVFGLLYDPVMEDAIIAEAGSEAQLIAQQRAPRVLSVSEGGPVESLVGFVPISMIPKDKRPEMAQRQLRFARCWSLRSSCQEFRVLAEGHVDFMLCTGLTPWDHAAGALIAKQAGGHVAMLDGSDYRADTREGYLLAASDAATWGRVRDEFDFLLDAKPISDIETDAEDGGDGDGGE